MRHFVFSEWTNSSVQNKVVLLRTIFLRQYLREPRNLKLHRFSRKFSFDSAHAQSEQENFEQSPVTTGSERNEKWRMLPQAVFLRVTLPTSVPRERGLVFSTFFIFCQNGILFPGVRSLLIKVTAQVMKLRRTTKQKREPKGSVACQ